jgi:predicted nucleic acid-binding protein
MSNFVVFDTSIIIDHLRTGRHQQRIAATTGLVRNSAVVLAKLSRAATKPREQEFVERLARNHPILTPTENSWLDSGGLLSTIHAAKALVLRSLAICTLTC